MFPHGCAEQGEREQRDQHHEHADRERHSFPSAMVARGAHRRTKSSVFEIVERREADVEVRRALPALDERVELSLGRDIERLAA